MTPLIVKLLKVTLLVTDLNTVPSEQNSYWGGGGGDGLPIVFLLIQYNVIKETYYSLTIIGGGGGSSFRHSAGVKMKFDKLIQYAIYICL